MKVRLKPSGRPVCRRRDKAKLIDVELVIHSTVQSLSVYMHILKLINLVDEEDACSFQPGLLAWLHSSPWAGKLSLVVSDLVKWRFGHFRLMVAAYTLQEMLTSQNQNDVNGRTKVYKKHRLMVIIGMDAGMPESFKSITVRFSAPGYWCRTWRRSKTEAE